MAAKTTEFLLSTKTNPHSRVRSNGVRFWGHPVRTGGLGAITCIGVHTTENDVMRGSAMNVARWQAFTAPAPTSYHVIVDQGRNLVRTLADVSTAFHIAVHNLNTRSLGLSFLHQAHRWGVNTAADRRLLETGAEQAAIWCRAYGIPTQWITLAQARSGVKGFIRHSVADPARRSDPGRNFPATEFFRLINENLSGRPVTPPEVARDYVTVGDNDPRVKEWKELASQLLPQSPNAFTQPNGQFGPQTLRLTLEALDRLQLPVADRERPRIGERSFESIRAALAVQAPPPPPPPVPPRWQGKRLRAVAPRVNFYDSPRWDRPSGSFTQGQHFPEIRRIVKTGNSDQYEVFNSQGAGPFYVTTRDDLVALVD